MAYMDSLINRDVKDMAQIDNLGHMQNLDGGIRGWNVCGAH